MSNPAQPTTTTTQPTTPPAADPQKPAATAPDAPAATQADPPAPTLSLPGTEPAPVAPAAKIQYMGRVFDSVEARDAFIQQEQARMAASRQPAKPTKSLDDLWFDDPAEARRMLEAQITQKVESQIDQRISQREQQTSQAKQFWEGFYAAHPDLREADTVVKMTLGQHSAELYAADAKAPGEGAKLLAERVRSVVDPIRKSSTTSTTELPSGRPHALGASGQGMPAVTKQPAPMNFIDQVKAARPKKRA